VNAADDVGPRAARFRAPRVKRRYVELLVTVFAGVLISAELAILFAWLTLR